MPYAAWPRDRKSTRLNSSHTEIYTLSLHDALPISLTEQHSPWAGAVRAVCATLPPLRGDERDAVRRLAARSEEHTSELQSHRDLHSFPTRRSSDLADRAALAVGGRRTRGVRDAAAAARRRARCRTPPGR